MSFAQMFILRIIDSWSWLIKKEKPHMFIWRLISKTNPEKKIAYSACMEHFNYCATDAMLACWTWTRQVFMVPG